MAVKHQDYSKVDFAAIAGGVDKMIESDSITQTDIENILKIKDQ